MLKHLPQNREALELAVDLRLEMRPWLRMLGEQERVIEQFSAAESLAEELGDKRRLARCLRGQLRLFLARGRSSARHQGRRTRPGPGDRNRRFRHPDCAQVRLTRVYVRLGDYRRAIDLCEQNLSSLKGRPVGERNPFGMQAILSVATRSQHAVCLGEVGELAQGIGWAQEAVQHRGDGRPFSQLVAAYSSLRLCLSGHRRS